MEIKLGSQVGEMLTLMFQNLTLTLHLEKFRRESLMILDFGWDNPMVTHQIVP